MLFYLFKSLLLFIYCLPFSYLLFSILKRNKEAILAPGLNVNKCEAEWLIGSIYETTHKSNILVVVFDFKVLQNLENIKRNNNNNV